MDASNPERPDASVASSLKYVTAIGSAVAIIAVVTGLLAMIDFKTRSIRLDSALAYPITESQVIVLAQLLLLAIVLHTTKKLRREIAQSSAAEQKLRDGMLQLALAASVDGLTGLSDSRAFDRRMVEEWKRAIRSKAHLAVVIIDIDYLSRYNDMKGNQRGDIVLKIVADCIQGSLKRSGDFVGRIGGEEFAVLLPDTNPPGALVIAERIRAAVQAVGIAHSDSPVGVMTVSAGVTSMVPTYEFDVRDFLDLADKAMHEAKNSGRNRVLADDGVEPMRQTA